MLFPSTAIADIVYILSAFSTPQFLRVIAECFARLSHGLGVCPSVCLSVRHTAVLYQNGAS